MAIGINLADDELPQEGIGISSSLRDPPEIVVGHGRGVGSIPNTIEMRRPRPAAGAVTVGGVVVEAIPGLLEFPAALPAPLLALVAAFCDDVTRTREPNQLIGRADSPYIDRWFLARKATIPDYVNDYARDGELRVSDLLLPSELENLYLHAYSRGDPDVPHDHPWPNASLVVRGWYRERCFDAGGRFVRCEMRRAGDIVLRSAGSIHAIVETSGDCLSLFATMRKERDWGFWRDGEFVRWQDFRS